MSRIPTAFAASRTVVLESKITLWPVSTRFAAARPIAIFSAWKVAALSLPEGSNVVSGCESSTAPPRLRVIDPSPAR